MEGTENQETGLIVRENVDITKVFAEGDVDPMLADLAEKAKDFTPDTSTDKGRKEIASRSGKVSSARSMLDKLRKQSIEKYMEIINKVNASGKKIQEFTAELRDEVREPLTKWEAEEKKQIEEQARREAEEAEEQAKREKYEIKWVEAHAEDDLFNRKREIEKKEALLKKQEEDRKAAEEKVRLENERIAHEAHLKKNAEDKAKKDAADEIARNKEIAEKEKLRLLHEKAKLEQDAINAQRALDKAEQDAIDAELQAKEDKRIAVEKAEEDKRIAVEVEKRIAQEKAEKAEKEKQDAIVEEKRKAEVEAARIEKERKEKEFAEQERLEKERLEAELKAADLTHRKTINNEILADLTPILEKADTEPDVIDIAKRIIGAIATGKISHVSIKY